MNTAVMNLWRIPVEQQLSNSLPLGALSFQVSSPHLCANFDLNFSLPQLGTGSVDGGPKILNSKGTV